MRKIKRMRSIFVAFTGGSLAYISWLFRPLTSEEQNSWNAVYLENNTLLLRAYVRAPLNAASRLWGRFAHTELPPFARRPLYGLYTACYGCDLAEAASGANLVQYRSFSEFFRRELKPGVRPVCADSGLVSPADGTVLHLGHVEPDGRLEQVKGLDYTLQGFLGPQPTAADAGVQPRRRVSDSAFYSELLVSPSSKPAAGSGHLYHCVIYLSPGDYHRFHSPADWSVLKRRHFPGYLMSVSPPKASRVGGLFCLNERAVYLGNWRHGFFALAAVGATNVGSIGVYRDPELRTNRERPLSPFHDHQFPTPLAEVKGALFGEFDLGSTIVLVFEAPSSVEFAVVAGQRVKVGQALARV